MASLDYDRGKGSRRDVAVGLCVALVILVLLAVAGHTEATSLDPNTGCGYGQILTSEGVCR